MRLGFALPQFGGQAHEAVRAEEVIVDFMYQASSVSAAVDLAGQLLAATRRSTA